MTDTVVISVDAMGGDHAPRIVVQGLNRVLKRDRRVRFLLFGREPELTPMVRRYRRVRDATEIRHTDAVVAGDDRPSVALRSGRGSSMRLAIDAVAAGDAHGVVSAGNTGALMAMAKFVLRTLPGIDRPAIASLSPTCRGRTVMLDLGANIDCRAENLVQFAVMGEVFARKVLGIDKPTVGLLNVGEEEVKGNEAVREAAAILRSSARSFHFQGFVEGDDIGKGTVDVIVTDGFTGNIALKTMEGTARLYSHMVKQAIQSSWLAKIGALIAQPAVRRLRRTADPRQYNGAVFLGLNGICVKSHGGTDGIGFANAINVAIELVRDDIIGGIRQDFEGFPELAGADLRVAAAP